MDDLRETLKAFETVLIMLDDRGYTCYDTNGTQFDVACIRQKLHIDSLWCKRDIFTHASTQYVRQILSVLHDSNSIDISRDEDDVLAQVEQVIGMSVTNHKDPMSKVWLQQVYKLKHDEPQRDVPSTTCMTCEALSGLVVSSEPVAFARLSHPPYDVPKDSHTVWIYFPQEEKLGVKPARVYRDSMLSNNVRHALLVCIDGISSFTKREFASQPLDKSVKFEVFKRDELQFPMAYHMAIGPHKVLSTHDSQQLLAQYKLHTAQMPRIQASDPLARYYGLQKGQIIKFIRRSGTLEPAPFYRIVW